MLTGPWDEDFIILQPGERLALEDFRLDLSNNSTSLSMLGLGRGDNQGTSS